MATMPVDKGFVVTSPLGPRWGTTHWGVDYGVAGGSGGKPIYAVRDGLVTRAGATNTNMDLTTFTDSRDGRGFTCPPSRRMR